MGKKCYIFETLSDVKKLNIIKEDDLISLSGIFGICGMRNNNNRIYEVNNYTEMINNMHERILKNGGIPGELEHPASMNITLENISHKITDISIDENGVVTGTIKLLNTPKGKIAQAIVEGGLPLYISSRATGSVDQNGMVKLESLQTYDLVGSPGFSQAELHLNESLIRESLSIDSTQDIVALDNNIYYITEKMNKNMMDNYTTEYQEQLNNLKKEINTTKSIVQEIMDRLDQMSKGTVNSDGTVNSTGSINADNTKTSELETTINTCKDELCTCKDDIKKIKEDLNSTEVITLISEAIEKWYFNEIAPKTQEWITENFENVYSEDLKNNIISEISENIKSWVNTEYSEQVQDWFIQECATNIQKWILDEFVPASEAWLNEEYMEVIKNKINESLNESKKNSLSSIDETLKLLENYTVSKPKYGEIENTEPKYITEMPDSIKPKWNMASKEIRENISRKAKLYNFNTPNAINEFWENIDFNAMNIIATQPIYEQINEFTDKVRLELLKGRFGKK